MTNNLYDSMEWNDIVEKVMEDNETKDKKFKKWMLNKKDLGNNFFGSKTWNNCYSIYKIINNQDNDFLEVIIGKEGSGKSTHGIQRCGVIDSRFCSKDFIKDAMSLFQWFEEHKGNTKGKALIIDEGALIVFNREGQKLPNIKVIQFLQQCRYLNMYIVVCIPRFKSLDPYIRQDRVKGLIRIKRTHKTFVNYNEKAINILNRELNKGHLLPNINCPHGTFYEDYWTKHIPHMNDISDLAYREIKDKTFRDWVKQSIGELQGQQESPFIPVKAATKIVPTSIDTIKRHIKEGKLQGMRFGNKFFVNKDNLLENARFEQDKGDL